MSIEGAKMILTHYFQLAIGGLDGDILSEVSGAVDAIVDEAMNRANNVTWAEANQPIVLFKSAPGTDRPRYQTDGAAGMDLTAIETVLILPGETELVKTGLQVELPAGYEAQVRSRSGLALKESVFVLNSPGTIDSDYRGDVGVILHNAGRDPIEIKEDERIAQLVVTRVCRARMLKADQLSGTDRGAGGFGSTGKKGNAMEAE